MSDEPLRPPVPVSGDSNLGSTRSLSAYLTRIADGDLSARDRLIEACSERLHVLAHRMLIKFPRVRRWSDTDDVFQMAALRLHRSLAVVQPDSARGLLALAVTQIHRELVDLARRYGGRRTYEANHGTNVLPCSGSGAPQVVEKVAAPQDRLDRWTTFHEAVEKLPSSAREVFDLVWYMGANQHQVAVLLGCSIRTVKSRWREARLAVREALDGLSPED